MKHITTTSDSVKIPDGVKCRKDPYGVLDSLHRVVLIFPISEDQAVTLLLSTSWVARQAGAPAAFALMDLVMQGKYTPHDNDPSRGVFYACGDEYPTDPAARLRTATEVYDTLASGNLRPAKCVHDCLASLRCDGGTA